MPGPQSTLFFLLLMAVFGALIWWLVVTKQMVFRVLAACLAFVPAMIFGVAAVNKYYDYYQNWNAAIADFTNQGVQAAAPPASRSVTASGISTFLGRTMDRAIAKQVGYTMLLTVRGKLSHLDRSVYVYLPPQYFAPEYSHYRFPVIELLQGFPGVAQDWITVMDVTAIMNKAVRLHKGAPAVLVMPDTEGGRRISLQCLNQVGGPQDATFLAEDLPAYIERVLRVQPTGQTWGLAGYSEGGFCAANLGLQHGHTFGYAGVLSGYFAPGPNQLGSPPRSVSPFGGNRALQLHNTPRYLIQHLPVVSSIPQFWIGAGAADTADVAAANLFYQELLVRQPLAELRFVPGGGHTATTWRALLPGMMDWMTTNLSNQVKRVESRIQVGIRLNYCRELVQARKETHPPVVTPPKLPSFPGLRAPKVLKCPKVLPPLSSTKPAASPKPGSSPTKKPTRQVRK